jgi:N-methylhydantoinase A/oxoprolinase/acetone carboxylase beta subunit
MADMASGESLTAAVFRRQDLTHGAMVNGPAAIVEPETTVLVPAGGIALMQSDGTLDLRLDGDTTNA